MSLLWRSIDEGVAQAKKGVALRAFGLGGMNEGFRRMKEKWTKEIEEFRATEAKKTHIAFSGGNVSFYYILPSLIKRVKNKSPLISIKAVHVEALGKIALESSDVTCNLAESSPSSCGSLSNLKGRNEEYEFAARRFLDSAYTCIGTCENADSSTILWGRPATTFQEGMPTEDFYKPSNLFGRKLRMISDQCFTTFEGVALGHGVGLVLHSAMNGRKGKYKRLINPPKYSVERVIIKDKRLRFTLSFNK